MDFLEKVEKLRQSANVTYEEAKTALEQSDGDLLEAIILLEKQGRVQPPPAAQPLVSAAPGAGDNQQAPPSYEPPRHSTFGESCGRFVRWLGNLIRKANENYLQVRRKGEMLTELPILFFLLLMALGFWFLLPLMVVSLFFEWSYGIRGPHLGKKEVNDALDKAAQTAENVKNDIKKGMNE